MNPAAPVFATGTRVAGAVLIAGYVTGLVPGAIVSLVGGLALITFGRAIMLDRAATGASVTALAVAAGALGIPALRWGTLSLQDLVGAQSVLGPTILVGPNVPAIASGVALAACFVAAAAWVTQPEGTDRPSRVWSRFEGVLAVAAATLVFAAPGSGGSATELFGDATSAGVTGAALAVGVAAVLLAPRLFRSSKLRWGVLIAAAVAVLASAAIVAGTI